MASSSSVLAMARVLIVVAFAVSMWSHTGAAQELPRAITSLTKDVKLFSSPVFSEHGSVGGRGNEMMRLLQDVDCDDFVSSQVESIRVKAKDPTALGNSLCSPQAQALELKTLLNPDSFFTKAKFGEFAECAKIMFLESNSIYRETSSNATRLSNSTTCRAEVSAFSTEIINEQDTLIGEPNRRRLLIGLILIAVAAMSGPVLIELSVELTAEAILRARKACSRSSQCSRNRCCRKNAKNENVCIIKPAIRRNRERLCLP